jgi:hypothetical protein
MSQKHNAISHGLYAKEALLPHENRAEYLRFRRKVIAELLPDGHLQIHLANQIADDAWRMRRLDKLILAMQNQIYEGLTPQKVCEFAEVDRTMWDKAPQFITNMQKKFNRAQISEATQYCREYRDCLKNFKNIPHLQAVQEKFSYMFDLASKYIHAWGEKPLISSITKKFEPAWHANNDLLWERLEKLYALMYFRKNWKHIQKTASPLVESWYLMLESRDHHLRTQKQNATLARNQFSKQLKAYTDTKKSLIQFSGVLAKLIDPSSAPLPAPLISAAHNQQDVLSREAVPHESEGGGNEQSNAGSSAAKCDQAPQMPALALATPVPPTNHAQAPLPPAGA